MMAESPISGADISLRVLLAFAAGALLGWERQSHGRAAGLRTTILTSVAAAIAVVVSDVMFQTSSTVTSTAVWRPDPARMAQGILTGIGFLGAGTILRETQHIRGVTTAATLWFATILGIAFGLGFPVLGICGTAIGLFTLHVLPFFEGSISEDWYACVIVKCSSTGPRAETLRYELDRLGVKVKAMRMASDLTQGELVVTFDVKLYRSQRFEMASKAVSHISAMSGVMGVSWD